MPQHGSQDGSGNGSPAGSPETSAAVDPPEGPSALRPGPESVGDLEADGDRSSVTDVNGTVARFDMSYSPPSAGRSKFGPPISSRFPSALYLFGAFGLGGAVLYAYTVAPSGSRLFQWVVERDRDRPLSAGVLAAVVVVSAIATVLRTHMQGVVVSDQWIEGRYLLPLGIPKSRRWVWTQIVRVVVDDSRVGFELWDGSFERLPPVARSRELAQLVVRHAQRRRIDVTMLEKATPN
jgi:hypothetical protein